MIRCAHFIAVALPLFFLIGCSADDPPANAANGDQSNPREASPSVPQAERASADPSADSTGSQPAPVDDAGRELTKWVLGQGGSVSAYVGNKTMSWESEAELPGGKIEPFRVKLEEATISDDDMKRFAGHPRLRDLYLNGCTVTDN